uniref:Secreted protein n=2 Tax=unclassified Streptomyces TaxID=2593676 RepID=A0AAU2AE51_9ACTN
MNVLNAAGRRRLGLLAPALAVLILPFSTGTASAAYDNSNLTPGWDPNTHPDVIADCNGGHGGMKPDLCQYHETQAWTSLGKRHQATNVAANCAGSDNGTYSFTASYATNTSYSYEEETKLEVNAGFSDVFEGGVKASTSSTEKWTVGDTRTTTQTLTNTIRPGYKGAYWFAPYIRHSRGWLEVHYNKRNHGHYYWYYPGKGAAKVGVDTPVALNSGELKGVMYWAVWKC